MTTQVIVRKRNTDEEEIRRDELQHRELEKVVARYLMGEIDYPTFRKSVTAIGSRLDLRRAGRKLKKTIRMF